MQRFHAFGKDALPLDEGILYRCDGHDIIGHVVAAIHLPRLIDTHGAIGEGYTAEIHHGGRKETLAGFFAIGKGATQQLLPQGMDRKAAGKGEMLGHGKVIEGGESVARIAGLHLHHKGGIIGEDLIKALGGGSSQYDGLRKKRSAGAADAGHILPRLFALLAVQQHIGFQQAEHLIHRLFRIVNTDAVVDILAAGGDHPALGDGDAEIRCFVHLGLDGPGGSGGDLYLFGAASGKGCQHHSGKDNGKNFGAFLHWSLPSLGMLSTDMASAGIIFPGCPGSFSSGTH